VCARLRADLEPAPSCQWIVSRPRVYRSPMDPPAGRPELRRNESAADFHAREAWLACMNQPASGWQDRGAGDIAYTMEALGIGPDGFAEVLGLARMVRPNFFPAGIQVGGYLFALAPPERATGEILGWFAGVAVVARTVTPR
jgi:hypothetical protein